MHPFDLSPHASSLPTKCLFFEPTVRIRSLSENQNSKTRALNRRDRDQGKRGRPRADLLTALMVEGSSSRSRIRCNKCSRVFPREKSLQAHLRTHTGERPYTCDYPGCMKAFCQSGQLKTHQRLHTGERPFVCVTDGCTNRFTHANRHCSQHPYAGLKRLEMNMEDVARLCEAEPNPDVIKWITKYVKQCRERANPKSPFKKTPSTENVDNGSVNDSTFNDGLSCGWSLPRIPSNQIKHNDSSSSPPLLLTTPLSQSSILSSPLAISSPSQRQPSASSTTSSSSGVSSMSTLSSSSTSMLQLHHDLTTVEYQNGTQDYIYSSQMILQGQYNDVIQPFCSTPLSSRNASPTIPDSNLMDYRIPPPNSPIMIQPMRCHTPSLLSKQHTSPLSSRLPTPTQHIRPITPTLLINLPSSTLTNKPPIPSLPSKPSTPTLSNKPPTPTLHNMSPTTILPSILTVQNKPTSSVQALTMSLRSSETSASVNENIESNSAETTSSIRYRTTPKNREKDRYISALALIELSKG